jgi:opacity protein-like surface antigen
VKKSAICLITLLIMLAITLPAQAADSKSKGEITGYLGNGSGLEGNYQLNDNFNLLGLYDQSSTRLTAGIEYQPSDRIGFKAGLNYDLEQKVSNDFYGISFSFPFGDNLKINGFCDRNYLGQNWTNYEAALRIQMYENHFLDAGVRGDIGEGALYRNNPSKETLLFIRGDFNWQLKKFSIQIRPVLYITGYLMNDYTLAYNLNDHTAIVANMTDINVPYTIYQVGLKYQF